MISALDSITPFRTNDIFTNACSLVFFHSNSVTFSINIALPRYINSSDAPVCMELH